MCALPRAKKVIAFSREGSYVFPSLWEAAIAYGVNRKIIHDKINDGTTLKQDGYTTFDWLFDGKND